MGRMKESISKKNFYELLGVTRDATALEIDIAFADLSRIYDPESRFFADIIDEPVTAEQIEIFELIQLAYRTLKDELTRTEYDRSLSA